MTASAPPHRPERDAPQTSTPHISTIFRPVRRLPNLRRHTLRRPARGAGPGRGSAANLAANRATRAGPAQAIHFGAETGP